jgi:hypothetical protein
MINESLAVTGSAKLMVVWPMEFIAKDMIQITIIFFIPAWLLDLLVDSNIADFE